MNIFTCNNLIAMGRHIPAPFYLPVMDEREEVMLRVDSILRIVPGKRIVALANWKDQIVIAKLFFRRGRWKQSMLRDLKGITLLRQASIPTPKVISQTTTADKQGAVLLIDYLRQSTSLLALLDEAKQEAEKLSIMEMGIAAIAQCHEAGLWQKDIHLDNFMLSNGKVYVLDGGEIQGEGKPLDSATCLRNLAVFFAQFEISMDSHIPQLLQHYMKHSDRARNTPDESLANELQALVVTARQRRLRTLERKMFRSTSAHRRVQSATRMAVYDRHIHSEKIEQWIRDPDALLTSATLLKDGNSSTVGLIRLDGRYFVLKRYNIKGFLHGLKRLVQKSRAHNSWRNSAMLEMLGIATPHAFMMIEERLFWLFRRRAWLLCEYVHSQNLLEQMELDTDESLPATDIMTRFKALFETFQQYHISHGDLKISNFIYANDRLYVLDLDAMQRHNSAEAARDSLNKDRQRFLRNFGGTRFEAAAQHMTGQIK